MCTSRPSSFRGATGSHGILVWGKKQVTPASPLIEALTLACLSFNFSSCGPTTKTKCAVLIGETALPVELNEPQVKRNDESDEVYFQDPGAFCVGDKINGRVRVEPEKAGESIRWELRHGESIKAGGRGRTFADQKLVESGTWSIIFYCDYDRSEDFTSLFDPSVQTERFDVRNVIVQDLTIVRHVDVPFTDAQADANLAEANEHLRKRNLKDDVRSCVELRRHDNVGTFGVHNSPIGTPPRIITNSVELAAVRAVAGDIRLVTTISWCIGEMGNFLGCTGVGTGDTVLDFDEAGPSTWAHEFGHSQGILWDHTDTALNHRVMFFANHGTTLDKVEDEYFRR